MIEQLRDNMERESRCRINKSYTDYQPIPLRRLVMKYLYKTSQVLGLWVLVSLTGLAFLNAGYVVNRFASGNTSPITPYLISQVVGSIDRDLYLVASLIAAVICCGGTVWLYVQQHPQSVNVEIAELLQRLLAVNQDVVKNQQDATRRIQVNLMETLNAHTQAIQQLQDALDTSISTLQRAYIEAFQRQETFLQLMLETVESALLPPKPRISGASRPTELKGIGPQTAKALATMGITTVDEFLIADPHAIGRQTRLSPDQAKRIQDAIPLLMIPEIDDADVELLARVGVTDRKGLAEQDPFALNVRLSKVYDELHEPNGAPQPKPTLEEVVAWVRLARI